MRKLARILAAGILAATPLSIAAVANADTPVQQCTGTWSVVVGGLNNNDSQGFTGQNQRVGYNSYDLRSGVNELNRLARDHRRACPSDHVKVVGHSGGAAVSHVWATENGPSFGGNVNVVLLADPKRPAGPGGPGFAAEWPFSTIPVLAGVDANYGGVPTLSVCYGGDHICQSGADWSAYMRGEHSSRYDFNVTHYSNWGNGVHYF